MKERMKRKPFLQPCCLVLAQKKSKYYSSISCLGTGKVEILQYYLTACRAFVTRLRTEKSKYHNTISWHAAPLVAINKYKSQNLSLTKYFITTLLLVFANITEFKDGWLSESDLIVSCLAEFFFQHLRDVRNLLLNPGWVSSWQQA